MKLIQGQGLGEHCEFCGVKQGKKHTEKCRQDWRDLILSYGVVMDDLEEGADR